MHLTLAAFAAMLLIGGPAPAQRNAPDRVTDIRRSVLASGVDACDVGTMRVPIVRRDLPGSTAAQATFYDDTVPFNGCLIEIDDRTWSTRELCLFLHHEFRHLIGRGHNTNPRSIMFPRPTSAPFAPCPRPRSTKPHRRPR